MEYFYFGLGGVMCVIAGVILGKLPFPRFVLGITAFSVGQYLINEGSKLV